MKRRPRQKAPAMRLSRTHLLDHAKNLVGGRLFINFGRLLRAALVQSRSADWRAA